MVPSLIRNPDESTGAMEGERDMVNQVRTDDVVGAHRGSAALRPPAAGRVAIIKSRGVPVGLARRGLDGGTLNLVNSVPALVAEGLQVSIFTSDIGPRVPQIERLGNVEIHRLPGFAGAGLDADALDIERARCFEARLLAYPPFADGSFEVIHTHHWTSALPGLLARSRCGRHVHTPHLLVAEKAAMVGKAPSVEALEIERAGLESADCVVAVSRAEARSITSRYGVAPAKVRVIPNGVSNEFRRRRTAPETISARMAARPLQIVSVGRLVPQKGFDTLLRAVALAGTFGLDLHCTIVGAPYHSEPAYPEALARLSRDLGLTSVVRFLGERDSAGVAACLASAAAYVQPSRYESQGVAILEAMAMGLPIVATRIPAVTEFVEHERNGLLVDIDDADAVAQALLRLADDPGLAAAMSAANRMTAADFDWRVSNRRLIDCLGFGDEGCA